MQPTIICTAAEAGVIYINGRFAGEASRARPLLAPVGPAGAVYLEYRPLSGEGSLARKLVFSGGAPLAEGLAEAAGLYCVAWPGGALEVEFARPRPEVEAFLLEGMPCELRRGEETALLLDGVPVALPEGAERPRLARLNGAAALLGEIAGGGQYLAALAGDLSRQTGLLAAQRIDPVDGGLVSVVVDLGDTVGHGLLEQWVVDGSGLSRASVQSVWAGGAPRWPRTAEDTMIAAVEAALAGQDAEAAGYLSPALARDAPLASIGEACDLCAPMKYGLPDARPCVALLSAVNDHLAVARPLYYRAEPVSHAQGAWQVEAMWME